MKKGPMPWLMLIFLALTWGSSFILMKRGLYTSEGSMVFSPQEVAGLRIILTFLVLLPVTLRNGKELVGRHWKPLLMVALFGNTIPAFLFPFALQHIDSALSGMLNSMVPLSTLLISALFFRIPVNGQRIGGVLLGLLGAIGLILAGSDPISPGGNIYGVLVLFATVCYGINANVLKYYLNGLTAIQITALAFAYMALPVGVYLFFFTDATGKILLEPEARTSFGYIAILAVVGTAIAKIVFNRLVNYTEPLFASSVTYLIPMVATFWGVLDGEVVGWQHLISGAGILGGVYLVHRSQG